VFSREPDVVRVGADYLVRVGPFYALTGLGMALYFASQGAGRVVWPFSAGVVRLALVALVGWYWVNAHHGPLTGLFWIVAASQLLFGAINALAMATGVNWKPAGSRIPEVLAGSPRAHALTPNSGLSS
jgi:Na+-driven multidrug efflux pump